MDYIRRAYGVPARRGAKVLYTPNPEFPPQSGVIVSAKNGHLRVRMDQPSLRGKVLTYKLHPTWRIEYLK